MSASDFVETLRTCKLPDPFILQLIVRRQVQGRICLFETRSKEYLLQPTIEAFHHGIDEESITSYLKLQYKKTDSSNKTSSASGTTFRMGSKHDRLNVEAVFIPLGQLVEVDKGVPANRIPQKRTTHYVVLFNMSTNPYSLWIVYDYKSYDRDCELGMNSLTDEGLHNKMTRHREQAWYATTHEPDQNIPNLSTSIINGILIVGSNETKSETLVRMPSRSFKGFQKGDRHESTGSTTPPLGKASSADQSSSSKEITSPAKSLISDSSTDSKSSKASTSATSIGSVPDGSAVNQDDKPDPSLAEDLDVPVYRGKSLDSRDEGYIGGNKADPFVDQIRELRDLRESELFFVNLFDSLSFTKETDASACRGKKFNSRGEVYDGKQKIGQVDLSKYVPKPAFTFLGLSKPFDLACISSDIARWTGDTGIDRQRVMDCLGKVNVCLGSTLRATDAKPKTKGHLINLEQSLKE